MSLYQQNQILNDSAGGDHIITTLSSNQNMIVDGSGNITTSSVALNTAQGLYMDSNTYYVSATHPDIGNGRVFSTIQDAFTSLSALVPTAEFTIIVAPGTYTESPTITNVECQLALNMTGDTIIFGTMTVDTQNNGTFSVNADRCFVSNITMTGATTNTPIVVLNNTTIDNTLETSACEALVTLRNCSVGTLNTRWLSEATNTAFFVQFTTKFADLLDNCSFDAMVIQIDSWQHDRSGFRNCNVTQPGGTYNGDRFRRCTNTWYSFNQQAWTITPPHIQIDLLEDTGVTAGSYTNANITVNAQGLITSASSGSSGGVTTVGPVIVGANANAASITGTTLNMFTGTSTTRGVSHSQTGVATNTALGVSAMPQYSILTSFNTAIGESALAAGSTLVAGANRNTAVGYQPLTALTSGADNTAVGSNAGRILTTQTNCTLIGSNAGGTAAASNITCVGTQAGSACTGVANTFIGYQAGRDHTSGINNTVVGSSSYIAVTTGHSNCILGANACTTANSAIQNVIIGNGALRDATTANNNIAIGHSAGITVSTGFNNVIIGSGAVTAAATNNVSIVIGANTTGNGSNTTTIGAGYVRAVAGGNLLSQDAGTGEILRAVSSLRYKNVIDQAPPVAQFAHYLFQLVPRGVTMKNDPSATPRISYIAEEVEQIVGPMGNPVFAPLLIYADLDDPTLPMTTKTETYESIDEFGVSQYLTREVEVPTKRRMVDGINYAGFVVPIIELLKKMNTEIEDLKGRLSVLEGV